MKVKFENQKYTVSFCDGLIIQFIKLQLFWKRQVRRLNVILSKQDIGLYLLITLFWIVFGVAIYFLGQHCIATENEPYEIIDVAWGLLEGWFSSVILSFAIGAFMRIGEYKRKIRTQHHIYVSTMDDFEGLTDIYIGQEANNFHPLYCDKCLEDTLLFIKNSGKSISISHNNETTLVMAIVLERLETVATDVKADSFVSLGDPLTVEKIDKVRWKFNQSFLDDNISPDRMCELLVLLKGILDKIREPWRVDVQHKINILQRLSKRPQNNILDDIYYKMLLQGHPFSTKISASATSERLAILSKKIKQGNPQNMRE